MTAPTIHLNGTSRDELTAGYYAAMQAVQAAQDATQKTAPNGRDYYPQGPEAYTAARDEHYARLQTLEKIRAELEALRAEGWTSTPKQDCDFVATWTPARVARCLSYADLIEDEDAGPAERAADRAERFAEYRDKRTAEAFGHADRYDAGPLAHGFQNAARAERAAARHDRQAGHAVSAWDKAEYWTRRTAWWTSGLST